jgi:hypothetical protein
LLGASELFIQREVKLKDTYATLPEDAKVMAGDMAPNERGNLCFRQRASPGNPCHLRPGSSFGNVEVQAGRRCGQPALGLVMEQRLARSYDHLGQRRVVLYE